MVYGVNSTTAQRIKEYADHGYVVHLMTGISWGEYQDYLFGQWDGKNHWDEAQMDRNGNHVKHGDTVPYMVPTISFSDYLTEKLKIAVDSGVVAIHLEEPEFWDFSGYSEAFKREYKLYYRKDWEPPHSGLEARYNCSRLKAYLYARALDRVCASLREYALIKHNRVVRFYVPTHSLLNYTQWKIMSPEGMLIDLPTIDGFIAQIWTGTSRTENVFEGVVKERTFETSYLEYGIMQELVKGTGKRMWFLHDPIEDNPEYPWENFEYNYLKTVTASLLHPAIHNYEICPWPNRVFNGTYPRKQSTGKPLPNAKPIPESYNTLLCNMINTLGDMDKDEYEFEGVNSGVGVLMSDTGLYQRTYPDNILNPEYRMNADKPSEELLEDEEFVKSFITGGTFPSFYGLSLPLLKYGLPVRPVLLDNVRRFPGYLSDYKTLVLSYEYMKPISPDINNSVAEWVKAGGTLVYVGDGSDPYHTVPSWWNTGRAVYDNPAQHLFEMLGLDKDIKSGIYNVGNGRIAVMDICPAKLCATGKLAAGYRELVRDMLEREGVSWSYTNSMTLRRGEYIISAVMDESVSGEPKVLNGIFADMYTPDFKIITQKVIHPDESALLADISRLSGSCIVGTSARVFLMEEKDGRTVLECLAPNTVKAHIRVRLGHRVDNVSAAGIPVEWEYDALSDTYLLRYSSVGERVVISCK
ncbi:MAG: hypothetical protein AB9835_07415 [Eubacteriales bacterium]